MARYIAYFNGKSAEVEAASLWAAKQQAVADFKPRKSQEHMVSVVLIARDDGTPVQVSGEAL